MKQYRFFMRILACLMLVMFSALAIYSGYSINTYGSRWFAYSHNPRVKSQKSKVVEGSVFDASGVKLAWTDENGKRQYQQDLSSRKAVVHLLGEETGMVANGVESFMSNYLLGFDTTFWERVQNLFSGDQSKGDDVTLTVDSKLCTAIQSYFPQGKNGAVVVMNYKTGAVAALSSFPNFDPMNITESDKTSVDAPLYNRVTKGLYPPGSTFKIITGAAALRYLPGVQTETFNCTGEFHINRTTVTDASNEKHGAITMGYAFAVSCNNTFAYLAERLGFPAMGKTAEGFGFNDTFLFRDLVVSDGSYPVNGDADELAWSGVGQGRVLTTPLHMCMVAASVANGGVMMEPRILRGVSSPAGVQRLSYEQQAYKTVMTESEASILARYMRQTVTSGSGRNAAVSGLTVCGKTGTAQYDDVHKKEHAWFVGYIDSDDYPYAIAVIVEDSTAGGSTVAAPIANKVFTYIKNNFPKAE
ncbi:MAG: penicillin-binding transpeptidase domain-containing protein [Eubacteriales bacterium]|nr:penicillin-binding transpeptidase domain-containing protein [Eubacteriales bacterium]MDD3882718.1 penicillin-binding transpeptidase domain-containing protein [Eubacteriales bacterium]MDD4512661.1 penicillin-binding transpeptidase domain-containing protein [Eubacteriales bacterium]